MTTPAAIRATYANLILVRSRDVVQIVLEAPIEHAEKVTKILGWPDPKAERWWALAALKEEPEAKPEKAKQSWYDMPRSQRAGILCGDEKFRKWFGVPDETMAAEMIRRHCKVTSRANLDTDLRSSTHWDALEHEYRVHAGLETAER